MTFTPDTYRLALERLVAHYPVVQPACPPWPQVGCLLRHDVDLVLSPAILALADVEQRLGVRSCWFIRVDGHYNPLGPGREVLEALVTRGHRIGLHYDAATVTRWSLREQRAALSLAVPVSEAITGHRPTLAGTDALRDHPHNPGSIPGHGYVADSRRTPLKLPDVLPDVLQVNTHPEHYITTLPLEEHYAALADELAVSR